MSTPKYFSYLPDVKYALSANKAGQITYAEMKDYFRMAVVRDDIFKKILSILSTQLRMDSAQIRSPMSSIMMSSITGSSFRLMELQITTPSISQSEGTG